MTTKKQTYVTPEIQSVAVACQLLLPFSRPKVVIYDDEEDISEEEEW